MIYSTILYLSVFFISILFLYIGENKKIGSSKTFSFFSSIGILLPCFLAAFRDYSVGSDVTLYVLPNFQFVKTIGSSGFFYYYDNMPLQTEIGFAFILYIGGILKSLSLSFFIMQLLVIIPIYLGLKKHADIYSLITGMICYFFLFYNVSLSAMRGCIAMSLQLYAFYYLDKKQYIYYILIILFGSLFHVSVLMIGLIVMLLYVFLRIKKNKLTLWVLWGFLLFFLLLGTHYKNLLMQLVSFVNPRYAYYLSVYLGDGSISDIPLTDLISKFLVIIISIYLIKKINFLILKDSLVLGLIVIVLIGRYFVIFNGVFFESLRVAYYFDMFLIFLSARVVAMYKKRKNRVMYSIFILMPTLMYWLHFIMIIGGYSTNVYKFV